MNLHVVKGYKGARKREEMEESRTQWKILESNGKILESNRGDDGVWFQLRLERMG
jgi:IS5 family transposase